MEYKPNDNILFLVASTKLAEMVLENEYINSKFDKFVFEMTGKNSFKYSLLKDEKTFNFHTYCLYGTIEIVFKNGGPSRALSNVVSYDLFQELLMKLIDEKDNSND